MYSNLFSSTTILNTFLLIQIKFLFLYFDSVRGFGVSGKSSKSYAKFDMYVHFSKESSYSFHQILKWSVPRSSEEIDKTNN